MKSFDFKIDPFTGEPYYEVYLRGQQLLTDPLLNKGSLLHHRGAGLPRPRRPPPPRRVDARGGGGAFPRHLPAQARRHGALPLPARAAQPQRDPVLQAAGREPRPRCCPSSTPRPWARPASGCPTSCGGRAGSTSTPTTSAPSTRSSPTCPLPHVQLIGGHRRRADPRPRRPRRRRHGHPGRQGQPVRRGRRASTRPAACRSASTSAPTGPAARGPALPRLPPAAPRGRGLRPLHRALRARGQAQLPRRPDPVGGLRQEQRLPHPRPLPRARSSASTTTSRAPAPPPAPPS